MTTTPLLKGRPAELAVLDYGLFRVHAGPRDIGLCGFAVRTDAGEVAVIDTGMPAKYARDPVAAGREDDLGSFGEVLSLGPENLPEAQLALLCIAPGDVTLMVQSHTHIDHLGGLASFPRAPMLIARAERDLPRPLYWRGAQPMKWPERDYAAIEGDVDVGPGFRALLVPGHAPGQLAFLLDLPETGPVLLACDAISRPAEIGEGFADAADPEAARASAARLMDLARETGAFVIYGHAPEQWAELRKAPEVYR